MGTVEESEIDVYFSLKWNALRLGVVYAPEIGGSPFILALPIIGCTYGDMTGKLHFKATSVANNQTNYRFAFRIYGAGQ